MDTKQEFLKGHLHIKNYSNVLLQLKWTVWARLKVKKPNSKIFHEKIYQIQF